MSTRLLAPIALLILWSIICWRWYVCGIKERCNNTPSPVSIGEAIPFPVDTFVQKSDGSPSPPIFVEPLPQPEPPADVPNDIDRVSIDAQPDLVLIHFPYNSTRQQDAAAAEEYLTQLANHVKSTRQKVIITGHTDNVGDSKSNDRLGLQRANVIKQILVKKGVPAEDIACYSKGEREPIATNDNPRGRYKNRRVEIRLTP